MSIRQVVIGRDDLEVVVLPELGARLHRVRAFGTDILRAPDDLELHRREPFFWGSYVMAPWGGRIAASPTAVDGRTIDLTSNFPDGTAIHGQLSSRPWDEVGQGAFTVAAGGDGWPWPYEAKVIVEVEGATLVIQLTVTNRADDRMPGGLGIHPWFMKPVRVRFSADRVYESNLASEPQPVTVAGDHDLRDERPMPDDLDATWTGLGSPPPVALHWPEAGIRATMTADDPDLHIVAASPATLDAVAIEPQTHAPQAIRRLLAGEPGALHWLDPGETLRLTTRLSFVRTGDA